jgi:hypothetical protein
MREKIERPNDVKARKKEYHKYETINKALDIRKIEK